MVFRRLLLFPVFILWISSINAQTSTYGLGDFYNSHMGSRYGVIVSTASEITGTPYENIQFVPGEVYTSGGEHYTGIPLRYNIYSGQMEYQKESGEIFEVSTPEKIDSILLDGSKYIYCTYLEASKVQKSYMKVLTEGIPRLLLKMKVSFHKAEPPALYKDAIPAGFDREHDDFYLSFPQMEAVPFSGKNEFLDILDGKQDETDQYLKSNKVRWNRPEDLVRLLTWFYTLNP